jgi:hypothetical protein
VSDLIRHQMYRLSALLADADIPHRIYLDGGAKVEILSFPSLDALAQIAASMGVDAEWHAGSGWRFFIAEAVS